MRTTVFDPNRGDVTLDSRRINSLVGEGNVFIVDETLGNDSWDGGGTTPFKTLAAALAAATANNGDTVLLRGTVRLTATLAWNKDGVNLVGQRGPSNNARSRISQTGATVFSPLVNVTAQGCQFVNFATFHGFDDDSAQICWKDGGGRNYYRGVQFLGGGHATAAAHAGMRSLLIDGGNGENLFEECTVGLDTITRATGNNASLAFTGGSPRNVFRRCLFQSLVSNAADVHVLIGSGGIDRYAMFEDCAFLNAQFGGPNATAMTAAMSVHASAGGAVIVRDPIIVGAGKLSAAGPVYVTGPVPTAGTSGLAVNAS